MLKKCSRIATISLLLSSASLVAHPLPAASAPPAAQVAAYSTMATSDGVTLAHRVAGSGMPTLFIHGGPGSGSHVVEQLAGAGLEARLQMVYLDQRGSGRSGSAPTKDYSLERVIKDIEELREHLKIKQWLVMSHSFGGIIATAYARKHPDRVRGMVLVNSILHLPASMESTASHGYALLPAAGRPPMDPAAPLPQRFGMVMGMLNRSKLAGSLMYSDPATEGRVQAAMQGAPANRDFAATLFQSGAIANYLEDMAPATAALPMPVLVISGTEDHTVGVDHYKSFRFPHQEVVLVQGKHFAMIEQAAEVDKALQKFVANLDKKPAG